MGQSESTRGRPSSPEQGTEFRIGHYDCLRRFLETASTSTQPHQRGEDVEDQSDENNKQVQDTQDRKEREGTSDVDLLCKVRLPLDLSPAHLNLAIFNVVSSKLISSTVVSSHGPRLLRVLSALLRGARQAYALHQQGSTPEVYPPMGEAFESLLHVAVLTQFVVKHLANRLSVEELMYQLEHFPVAMMSADATRGQLSSRRINSEQPSLLKPPNEYPAANDARIVISNPPDTSVTQPVQRTNDDLVFPPRPVLRVSYRNTYDTVFHVHDGAHFEKELRFYLIDWMYKISPADVWLLALHGCVFRDIHNQNLLSLSDLQRQVLNDVQLYKHVELLPIELRLPMIPDNSEQDYEKLYRHSVVNELFLEVAAFLPLTQLLLLHPTASPVIEHCHTALLELLLILFPLVSTDRGPQRFMRIRNCDSNPIASIQSDLRSSTDSCTSRTAAGASTNSDMHQRPEETSGQKGSSATALFSYFVEYCRPSGGSFPSTPFLSGFIRLMNCLYCAGPGLSELPEVFVCYLLSNVSLTNGMIRRQMARTVPTFVSSVKVTDGSDSPSLSFDECLRYPGPAPRADGDCSSFSLAPSATRRLINASTSVLCALLFHPTILSGPSDLFDIVSPEDVPICITRVRNGISASNEGDNGNYKPEFVLVNIIPQVLSAVTDAQHFQQEKSSYSFSSPSPSPFQRCTFPLLFDTLLATFCSSRCLSEHLNSLILYALVYRNRTFRVFCLTRTDTYFLVLPMLKVIHEATTNDATSCSTTRDCSPPALSGVSSPMPPAVTLLLLSLLILTRDQNFSVSLFSAVSDEFPRWFASPTQNQQLTGKPRSPSLQSKPSVGSILILILMKLISWNFSKARDRFGHEISGAIFCNVGPSIKDLHWLVSERFVSFTARLIKQLLRRVPSVALSSPTTNESEKRSTKFEMLLPFDYLNSHLQQLLLRSQLGHLPCGSPLSPSAASLPPSQATTTMASADTQELSSHACQTEASFHIQKEKEEAEEECIQMLQSTFHVVKGILIALSTSLLPDKIATSVSFTGHNPSPEIEVTGSTTDCSSDPTGPAPNTPRNDSTKQPSICSNLALLYAFLRSEETVAALQALQKYALSVASDERHRREALEFIQTYTTQYEMYMAYRTTQTVVSETVRGDELVAPVSSREELLSGLPPGVSCVSNVDLPTIPPPPTIEILFPDSHPTSRLLSFSISSALQLAPYVHYLLDLRSLILAEVDGEAPDFDDLEVEEALQRLSERYNHLPEWRDSANKDGAIFKTKKAVTASDRFKLFIETMVPPIPFTYVEAETSLDYFQPLVWKAIFLTRLSDASSSDNETMFLH